MVVMTAGDRKRSRSDGFEIVKISNDCKTLTILCAKLVQYPG